MMDMQKIGSFLKQLRKEKGLTQEQLAEVLGVAGRTVSRWETASNMPDLSVLIQLAEYYNVEIKEILDGKRRNDAMDRELKETLEKLADYSAAEKQKAARIGGTAFCIMFITCAAVVAAQLIAFMNLQIVAGETVALAVGGIAYLALMANGGAWDSAPEKRRTSLNDGVLSVVTASIFTMLYAIIVFRISGNGARVAAASALFFPATSVLCFTALRALAVWSNRKKRAR